jgi:hypothetical protein
MEEERREITLEEEEDVFREVDRVTVVETLVEEVKIKTLVNQVVRE